MKNGLIVMAALALATAQDAHSQRRVLTERCYGDRCVYYNRGGERLGSLQRSPTGRVVVRGRIPSSREIIIRRHHSSRSSSSGTSRP